MADVPLLNRLKKCEEPERLDELLVLAMLDEPDRVVEGGGGDVHWKPPFSPVAV